MNDPEPRRAMRNGWLIGVLILAGSALFAPAGWSAGEICITCNGPSATYRCQIAVPAGVDASRVSDRIAQFICVGELARQGRHENCSVRNDGLATCIGELRTVGLGALPPEPPAAGATATAAQPGPTPPAKEPGKEGPPQTMVELAKRTTEASKSELQKTGKAVGGAMKKTWECLTTFFTQC